MTKIQLSSQYKSGHLSLEEVRKKLAFLKKNRQKSQLSQGQEGLWALQKIYPENSAYNCPIVLKLSQEVNFDLFERACQLLVQQYPILQTVIKEEEGRVYQINDTSKSLLIQKEDLSHFDSDQINSWLREKAKEPFSFEKGPLFRIHLIKSSEHEAVVLLVVHHLIFDGGSAFPLLKTLSTFYQELIQGMTPTLRSFSKTYQDFIKEEKALIEGKEGERRLSYWREELKGPLLPLEFPTDFPRRPEQRFEGATYHHKIDAELAIQIKQFSQKNSIYLSTLFLSVFQLLLYRYTGQNEIITGLPFDERSQREYQDQIGFFINMIPIRGSFAKERSFQSFLQDLQRTIIKGISHSYPFTTLLRKLQISLDSSHSPIFQVGYFYQNFLGSTELQQLHAQLPELFSFEDSGVISQEGEYEIALEIFEGETEFSLHLKYNPDLYKESTISRFVEHYCILFKEALQAPEEMVSAYTFLSKTEEERLILDWNQTKQTYPEDRCFHELFAEQAGETPEAIAVVFEEQRLTYRELDKKSSILANYLQIKGVQPNQPVAICVDRSMEMIIGLLAIQKSGGAYVPLDPDFPKERLIYMLEDSKAKILLTHASINSSIEQSIGSIEDMNAREELLVVSIDEHWAEIEEATKQGKLKTKASPTDLAYVIYTSGSTGKPKGVMISHRALVNFLYSMKHRPGIQARERLLAVTTYSFDIAALELYLPLLVGAECKISSAAEQKNPEKLLATIQRYKPNVMQATPITWKMLFERGWRNEERLRILCGGEALPSNLRQEFIDSGSESWNLFGPTETTIWSTLQKIGEELPNSIGKPIANTQVYIVDRKEQLTPIGIPGELLIAGDGLAEGYWNRPELTKEKFVLNPFGKDPMARLYKTGDLARWLADGTIEYLGRMDQQVKLRGFRIELGEIESVLNSYPGIRQSVVILQETPIERLIAYYLPSTAGQEKADMSKDILAYAQDKLPDYMIPSFCFPIAEFPLTPNRKIDRKALKQKKIDIRPETRSGADGPATSQSEVTEQVLQLWEEVLQVEGIGIHDGFFEVGGNSILTITLAAQIQERFQCDFPPAALFKHNTVQDISRHLTGNQANHPIKPAPVIPVTQKESFSETSYYPDYYQNSLAIIGISCQFPGANSPAEFWQNLKEGRESVRFLSTEELKELGVSNEMIDHPDFVPIQSTITGKDWFDPDFFGLSPKDAALMDPQFRLLLLHSWQAVEDAGYNVQDIPDTSVLMSTSNHFYRTPLSSKDLVISEADDYVAWLLAQEGSIPTMISHRLGLNGPSLSVHTNCSSSLVGLYLAYQSLITGKSKTALVGGASIVAGTIPGYVHQPGLNFSSDGHLRAFDAAADGMIGGEGVAVILLKKALDAIQDRDHIYGLLRGIEVNNDGNEKVGFYAPSVKGQSRVIQRVLEQTGVDPETIGYIEAHGTGTKLGDPIEFSALTDVYRRYTDKNQFCGIGSVKTNLGHLDTAAGLAGCIKTALSLYHEEIPPSINYKDPNPQIDFENSPFFVNDRLKPWTHGNSPRRAALSSFGIGGTNVHAILEEYKTDSEKSVQNRVSETRGPFLIPLSARNEDNLMAYAAKFIVFLESWQNLFEDQESNRLERLAYTLQTGRKAMKHRVIFLVRTSHELRAKMQSFLEGKREESCIQSVNSSAQPDMELLEEDEDVRELIQQWAQKGKLKKLAKLWVNGTNVDWKLLYSAKTPMRMSLPTYPFSNEWVKPEVISETVFSQKSGSPLFLLHPLLHQNTSDLEEQRFSSSFNGEEFFFNDHLVNGEKVLPGVCYLEMSRAAVKKAAGRQEEGTSLQLKNMVWSRPITIHNPIQEVHLALFEESQGQIQYEIYTASENEEEVIVHFRGAAEFKITGPANVLDIEALKSQLNRETLSAERCYQSLKTFGLDFGAGFKGIQEIYKGDHQLLVQLKLPPSVQDSLNEYVLHPSIMDASLQSCLWLGLDSDNPQAPNLSFPFTLESLEILGSCSREMYAWVHTSGDRGSKGKLQSLNIDLCDKNGQVAVIMRGLAYKTDSTTVDPHQLLDNRISPISGKPATDEVIKTLFTSTSKPSTVLSFDDVPLAYHVCGTGDIAIVFVHGLGCDHSYWCRQISDFSERYTVVTLDLGGHGTSGKKRSKMTIEAFGQDLATVIKHLNLKNVILVGHSMGGAVIIEASSLIPEHIIGLVGVECLHDLDLNLTNSDEIDTFIKVHQASYGSLKNMIKETPDLELAKIIDGKMSLVPDELIDNAYRELLNYLQTMNKDFSAPPVLINSSDWISNNLEAARKYGVEVKLMKGVGHFVMLEDPMTFNRLLSETISQFLGENKSYGVASHAAKDDKSVTLTRGVQRPKGKGRRAEMKGLNVEQCVNWDLKELINNSLKIPRDRLHPDTNFADYGFDSIRIAGFARLLSIHFGIELIPALFYEHSSLKKLTQYFMDEHQEAIQLFYQENVSFDNKSNVNSNSEYHSTNKRVRKSRFLHNPGKQNSREPIAIIGMSGRFPQARTVEDLWNILSEEKEAVQEIPLSRFDWKARDNISGRVNEYSYKWCCSIEGVAEFDSGFFEISPGEAESMDPRQRHLLQECWKALEVAGYGKRQLEDNTTGIFVGADQGDYRLLVKDSSFTSSHDSVLASRLAYFLNLKGPAMTINTSCSSGLVAVHQACTSLRNLECDTAIVAGVNLMLTPRFYLSMNKAGMLSKDGKCYAFDKRANGILPGEAIAVVVLKRLSKAQTDGDPIQSVIRGSAINFDGKTNGITAPSGEAQRILLQSVYDQYQIDPQEIDTIATHGTGTLLGDSIEINALHDVFKKYTRKLGYCALTSNKSNIGHTFTASGLVSLICLVQSLNHELIPASLNCEEENNYINWKESPFYVNKSAKPWPKTEGKRRMGAVSSFGMSGTNAHLVVEEYSTVQTDNITPAPCYLLPLSAKTEEALQEQVQAMIQTFQSGKYQDHDLPRICHTLFEGRHHFQYRLAIVVEDMEDAVYIWKQVGSVEKKTHLFKSKVDRDFAEQSMLSDYIKELLNKSSSLLNDKGKYREIMLTLANFYSQGYMVDWQIASGENKPTKALLPTYPFSRTEHWVPKSEKSSQQLPEIGTISKTYPPEEGDVLTETETYFGWQFSLPGEAKELGHHTSSFSVEEKATLFIRQLAAEQLQLTIDEIGTTSSFFDMGLTSAGCVSMADAIQSKLLTELLPSLFFDYKTVLDLSSYLAENYADAVARLVVTQKELKRERFKTGSMDQKEASPTYKKKENVEKPLASGLEGELKKKVEQHEDSLLEALEKLERCDLSIDDVITLIN